MLVLGCWRRVLVLRVMGVGSMGLWGGGLDLALAGGWRGVEYHRRLQHSVEFDGVIVTKGTGKAWGTSPTL
jgi:hypothetical protein